MRPLRSALLLAGMLCLAPVAHAEHTVVTTHALFPGVGFGRAYGAKITVAGPMAQQIIDQLCQEARRHGGTASTSKALFSGHITLTALRLRRDEQQSLLHLAEAAGRGQSP